MWWSNKIVRVLRCRNEQRSGTLGSLLTAIGAVGGLVGEIKVIRVGRETMVRDVMVFADDFSHLNIILEAIHHTPGVKLLEVRDEVLEMHRGGKIAVRSRYSVKTPTDLRKVYTPGVAEVSLRIKENPEEARLYTAIPHLVAIVTDGTAVLGLGDIGPLAAMPVMEGKATLMETLVGLSGMPILLNTHNVDEIVDTVARIALTFGAIQLEDISAPRCFEIEERLIEQLDMPVIHDDQHGTAVVVAAALLNAIRLAKMDIESATIGQIGLGAAGYSIAKMLKNLSGRPVLGADLSADALRRHEEAGGIPSTLEEIMAKADIVVATTGVPGLIKPEMIRAGQVMLALSNPAPEIEPELAMEAGASFAADGKSVNNVLGFPGILRGAIDANVPYVSENMYLVAAKTIASLTQTGELVPNPLNREVHWKVARAVAQAALDEGLARADLSGYFDNL
ncbi:MAG: NAD-dependent malic enzyme [Chloroflexi bacterium]|nr:NAD-dependent malic enzyme [Chloroflexota bacterium]